MINIDTKKDNIYLNNKKMLAKAAKQMKLIPILYVMDNVAKSWNGYEKGILTIIEETRIASLNDYINFLNECKDYIQRNEITFKKSFNYKNPYDD